MPPTRRQRPKACDSCWRKKIRCDDRHGPCRNCETYKVDCKTTRADGSIFRRVVDVPAVYDLQSRNEVHSIITPPASRQAGLIHVREPSYRSPIANTLSSHHDTDRLPEVLEEGSTPPITCSTVFGHTNESLQGVVTIEQAAVPQRSKYAGKISTQVLAKSAEELFQDRQIRIRVMGFFRPLMSFAEDIPVPSVEYYPIVDRPTADSYVQAYFTCINRLFPILSEAQFRPVYEEFYRIGFSTDAVFVCSLNMVLALGARQNESSADSTRLFPAGWELYARVISVPYFASVQALLLMALELMHCDKDGQAMLAVGTAVRISQSLGIHRSLSAHKQPHERGFVEKEYHLRSRVWWACYCLDKKLSFEIGRPSAINDTECDVDPPGDLCRTPSSDMVLPDDESLFGLMVELCQIQSAMISRLFCTAAEDNPSLIQEIEAMDQRLLSWKDSFPSGLRIDEDLTGANTRLKSVGCLLLHCMYYNTMLVLHRAALFGEVPLQPHQQSQSRMLFAEVVCLNSGRALARTLNDLVSTPLSWPIVRWTTSYILNVLFTLYIGIMKNIVQWTTETDIALLKTMRHCFSKSNDNLLAISSFDALLDSLLNAIDVKKQRMLSQSIAAPCPVSSGLGNSHDVPMAEETEIDFSFGDFFGLNGNSNALMSMQFWPVDVEHPIEADELV